MDRLLFFEKGNTYSQAIVACGVIIALFMGFFLVKLDIQFACIPLLLSALITFLILLFRYPKLGLYSLLVYTFLLVMFIWEIGDYPFGIGIECLLLLTFIAAVFHKQQWKKLHNPLVYLGLFWLIFSVLEIFNPYGASLRGWLQEARSAAVYPLLFPALTLLLMTDMKDLDRFLWIVVAFSLLAALNGIKQSVIGPWPGEQRFLDAGGSLTHIIWGQLRVFSFYSDAGQFGASQAHLSLICLILTFGEMAFWRKTLLLVVSLILFYGMLLSGTRGALFVLVVGSFFALFLSKRLKFLLAGGALVLLLMAFLKFTHIGSSNYHIYRLRSALDTHDASLNVRLQNQALLANYLDTKPLGGGLGVIGKWGKEYNPNKFLSTIEPDSYWVKIWASYGIVGLVCWFSMMMYLLGQCCAICWRIRDRNLRVKVIALTAGIAGIIFCSYGNEVMNAFPSSAMMLMSWGLVYLSPAFDQKIAVANLQSQPPQPSKGWVLDGDVYRYQYVVDKVK